MMGRDPDLIFVKEETYDDPIGQHMRHTDDRKSKSEIKTNPDLCNPNAL